MPSHGSLTKAGKVRDHTPRIPAKPRKNLAPRPRNRKEYIRFLARNLVGEVRRYMVEHGLDFEQAIREMMPSTSGERKQALRYLLYHRELFTRRWR